MKMAPLMGLVVKLPSNVLWMVTRYTLVSSTNLRNNMTTINQQMVVNTNIYGIIKIGTRERGAKKMEEGRQVLGGVT